jgi:hypothetical protein
MDSHQNAAGGHRRDDAACRRERQPVILLPAASFAPPSFVFAEAAARIADGHPNRYGNIEQRPIESSVR